MCSNSADTYLNSCFDYDGITEVDDAESPKFTMYLSFVQDLTINHPSAILCFFSNQLQVFMTNFLLAIIAAIMLLTVSGCIKVLDSIGEESQTTTMSNCSVYTDKTNRSKCLRGKLIQ